MFEFLQFMLHQRKPWKKFFQKFREFLNFFFWIFENAYFQTLKNNIWNFENNIWIFENSNFKNSKPSGFGNTTDEHNQLQLCQPGFIWYLNSGRTSCITADQSVGNGDSPTGSFRYRATQESCCRRRSYLSQCLNIK